MFATGAARSATPDDPATRENNYEAGAIVFAGGPSTDVH
jgi:hypothetical protein